MAAKIEARVTHRFKASAEKVYDAWLDPDKVRIWMAASLRSAGLSGEIARVEIDAHVGGRFCFSDMRDGVEARHIGTYLELERPRRIVFTWIPDEADVNDPSKVTLTIQPAEPEGCVVTLIHEMDAKWAEYLDRTEGGWSRMLHAIGELTSD